MMQKHIWHSDWEGTNAVRAAASAATFENQEKKGKKMTKRTHVVTKIEAEILTELKRVLGKIERRMPPGLINTKGLTSQIKEILRPLSVADAELVIKVGDAGSVGFGVRNFLQYANSRCRALFKIKWNKHHSKDFKLTERGRQVYRELKTGSQCAG